MSVENGLWLTHKKRGDTSFATVRAFSEEASRAHPGRRTPICHGGTLDPFAEGLLLVLVGPTTQLMDLHHPAPKTYVAEVSWGEETDNGDPLGTVVARGDPSSLAPGRLDEALRPFLGWTDQVPPATSAKKIGGEPAYRKAHRGEPVELPPSRVYLHAARWLDHRLPRSSTLELVCRGGFYVRSLVQQLGRDVGCYAHVGALNRTAIGPWRAPPEGERRWVPPESLLPWYPSRVLDDQELGTLRAGGALEIGGLTLPEWQLPVGFPAPPPLVRAVHRHRLVGLLKEDRGRWVTEQLLRGRW